MLGAAEVAAAPALPRRRRRSSRTRRRCSTRSSTAGRAALRRGGRAGRRGRRWPTRARRCCAWDRAHRPAADAGDRLAGPPRRGASARELRRHADAAGRSCTGLVARPVLLRARRCAWLRDQRDDARASSRRPTPGWCTGCAARSSPTPRPPAGRCCSTSTTAAWSDELLALFGLDAEALPDIVACDDVVGDDDGAFGGDAPGHRPDRRPAGRAARRGLPRGRDGQVHLRHRRVPARAARRASRCARRPGLTTSVAWRLRGAARRTASTGRSTRPPRRCAGSTDLGLIAGADELDAGRRRRASDGVLLRARARRARRAVVGRAARPRRSPGMTLEHAAAATSCAALLRGHRRPGRRR